jgi:succinoglycan biosynthesis transport protein ExoP
MCWMHRLQIVLIWGVLTAITVAVVYRLPAIYTSEALILVDAQKIPERFVSSTVNNDIQDRLATISQQILSSARLQKIIDDFGLYREQRKTHVQEEIFKMMRDDITVKLERGWTGNKPGAFRVGYSGPNPALVAQVANRIASLYIEENLRSREIQAEGTSEFIQTQLEEAKKKLNSLEGTITNYKIKHTGELPEQQGVLGGTLNRLQLEQNSNRDATDRAEATKATLENTLRLATATLDTLMVHAGSPATPQVVAEDGTIVSQAKPSEILEGQLTELSEHYGDAHPEVKRLKAEIARAKAAEAQAPAASTATVPVRKPAARMSAQAPTVRTGSSMEIGQARERIDTLKSQVALADKEIAARKDIAERVAQEISNIQGRLTNIPVREQEIAEITRDLDSAKGNYRSLLDKDTSAEMATDMERRQKSERFTLLDPARVPEKPFKPNRTAFIGLGTLFGSILALGFAIGREAKKGALLGDWEIPAYVPVVAYVPDIRNLRKRPKKTAGQNEPSAATGFGSSLIIGTDPPKA